jgi:pectin methylesterase-like acyl-CoA thioesterase
MELDYIKAPYPVAERAYYVSPNFTINKTAHQYPTIQSAIDAAYSDWGDVTDTSHVPIILVYPGRYEEQIHLYRNYHIQGFTHEVYTGRYVGMMVIVIILKE